MTPEQIKQFYKLFDNAIKDLKTSMKVELVGAEIVTIQGKQGPKGQDGKTPVKGKDYLTNEEREAFLKEIMSKVKMPENGLDGIDGKDGKDAVVDYEKLEKFIDARISGIRIPQAKDGKDAVVDYKMILKEVEKMIPKYDKDAMKTYIDGQIMESVREMKAMSGSRQLLSGGPTTRLMDLVDVAKSASEGQSLVRRGDGFAFETISGGGGAVDSVNGQTGTVVLTTSDVAEGSNLYYTNARFDTQLATKTTTNLSEGSNLYFTEARVRSTPLTGLSITGSAITSSDTVLSAFGKIQNQINAVIGGLNYQGGWNATTNSPSLSSGVGTKGYYYMVTTEGTTDLDGISTWNIGDWAVYNGTAWQKVDNTDAVISVNGYTGIVTLAYSDIIASDIDITGYSVKANTIELFDAANTDYGSIFASDSEFTFLDYLDNQAYINVAGVSALGSVNGIDAGFSTGIFSSYVQTPTISGGTTTTSDIIIKTTSGVGTTASQGFLKSGNNGAIENMSWASNIVVFNEGGADIDFRIESDTNPNMFVVDAGLESVAIGAGGVAGVPFRVHNASGALNLRMTNGVASTYRADFGLNTSGVGYFYNYNDSGGVYAVLQFDGNPIRMNASTSGSVSVGLSTPAGRFHAKQTGTSNPAIVAQTDNVAGRKFLSYAYADAGTEYGNVQIQSGTLRQELNTSGGIGVWEMYSNNGDATMQFVRNAGQPYVTLTNGTITGYAMHCNTTDGFVMGALSNHNAVIRTNNVNRITITSSAIYSSTNDQIAIGTTTNGFSDIHLATGAVVNFANGNATITHSSGLLTSNVDIIVPDEAYDATAWNGSLEVPTKNAIRDKIESMTGAGLTWTEVTGTSQSAAVNNGYIANNAALVTVTLPTTAAVGSIVRVVGKGAGGWKIAQNASEQIIWNEGGVDGTDETTVGTGGYLASTDDYDAVELVCIVADTTWTVLSSKGNITLA